MHKISPAGNNEKKTAGRAGNKGDAAMSRAFCAFWKSSFYSMLVAASLAAVLILTQVPGEKDPVESQASAPVSSFVAQEKDRFSLLCSLQARKNEPPYAYFLLGFDGPARRVYVTALPPQTRLSSDGGQNRLLSDLYRAGGGSAVLSQLNRAFSLHLTRRIALTDRSFTDLVDRLGGVTLQIPRPLAQVDPDRDLYIRIEAGRQHFTGLLLLDYLRYTGWPNGINGQLSAGSQALAALIAQQHCVLSLSDDDTAAELLLAGADTDLSVMDIERRRPLLCHLLSETPDVCPLPLSGSPADGNTAFLPDDDFAAELRRFY